MSLGALAVSASSTDLMQRYVGTSWCDSPGRLMDRLTKTVPHDLHSKRSSAKVSSSPLIVLFLAS